MGDYNTIGKTVVEYTDNGRHIACLKKQLSDIGEHLALLASQLQQDPSSVSVTPNGIQIVRPHSIVIQDTTTVVPLTVLDNDALQQILVELNQAQQTKEQLDKALRGMRLDELIRDDER